MRSIITALSFVCIASSAVACAAPEEEEAPAAASEDALSQAECNRIVGAALTKAKTECAGKKTAAETAQRTRESIESGVASALGAFVGEVQRTGAARSGAIADAVDECGAIGCSGELRGDDVKAECGVERAFLQAACYVRHIPAIKSVRADFSDELANLEAAWERMDDQWWSLAKQEVSLRAQHAACAPYAGSDAQRFALEKTCRASCNENDATNLGSIQTGHGSTCSPAGYEEVKDDLGNVVECGAMKRPLSALGTVCECQEQKSCGQFAAIGASSERGKPCTTASGARGFKKVVWSNETRSASLQCR